MKNIKESNLGSNIPKQKSIPPMPPCKTPLEKSSVISYEEFKEVINFLKEKNDMLEKANSYLRTFEMIQFYLPEYENLIVKLLKKLMNIKDNPKEDLLEWWIWDKDFGRGITKGDIVVDGKSITLTSCRELYDFLIETYNK